MTPPPAPVIWDRPIVTVGGLIVDESGRVLLLRTAKWSGLWGIPGGKIEFGETAEQALVRELREETGLEVRDVRLVCVQDCIGSAEFYRPAHFVLLNYVCRASSGGPVVLNDEAEESRWVTTEAAVRLPLNRPTALLIEAWLRGDQFSRGAGLPRQENSLGRGGHE